MELTDILRMIAATTAVFGGSLSVAAFYQKRRETEAGDQENLVRVLYLTSYVLMSISMAIFAFSGLLLDSA